MLILNDDLEFFEDRHQKIFNYAKKFLMKALMLDKSSSAVSFTFLKPVSMLFVPKP